MKKAYIALVGITTAITLAIAGCSSSSGSPQGPAGSSQQSSVASTSQGPAFVAAAKAQLATFTARPTSIPLTTKIDKPIPTGKTIDFISCGIAPTCNHGPILQSIAAILGWKVNVLNTDGSSAQIQNAWVTALRGSPDAIFFAGTSRTEEQQYLTEAHDRGIFVAGCCINEPDGSPSIGNGIDFNVDSAVGPQIAPVFASWLIAHSAGQGHAVFVATPAIPFITTMVSDTRNEIAKECPKCTLDTLNLAFSDFGSTGLTLIVTYLRSHPDVKYVILGISDSEGSGLPQALKNAGLSDVLVTGNSADSTIYNYIKLGQQDSTVSFPIYEVDYAEMDAAARFFAGVPVIPAFAPPLWLVTKGNVPSTSELFPNVVDIKSQFMSLWGK